MGRDPTIEFYLRESETQRAEIERLRAELDDRAWAQNEDAVRIANLRAELEASRKDAAFQCERAADKDCVIESLRAELADVKSDRQHFVDALAAQVERTKAVEATARQDAEEKARLREALILARREISDHDSDYHHRTRESTIEAIRAALACRPQEEKS